MCPQGRGGSSPLARTHLSSAFGSDTVLLARLVVTTLQHRDLHRPITRAEVALVALGVGAGEELDVSATRLPPMNSARPRGPYEIFAYAWVATAGANVRPRHERAHRVSVARD